MEIDQEGTIVQAEKRVTDGANVLKILLDLDKEGLLATGVELQPRDFSVSLPIGGIKNMNKHVLKKIVQ